MPAQLNWDVTYIYISSCSPSAVPGADFRKLDSPRRRSSVQRDSHCIYVSEYSGKGTWHKRIYIYISIRYRNKFPLPLCNYRKLVIPKRISLNLIYFRDFFPTEFFSRDDFFRGLFIRGYFSQESFFRGLFFGYPMGQTEAIIFAKTHLTFIAYNSAVMSSSFRSRTEGVFLPQVIWKFIQDA